MSPKKALFVLALGALLAVAPARAERVRTHFDSDSAGRPPGYFDLVVWGSPGEAEWKVLGDVNPPSTPNKLLQTVPDRPAGSIAVALRKTYTYQDGNLSVALRKGTGLAGIALRAAGEKDFLVLFVDVASGDARLSSYRGGKSTELARGKAAIDREWGTLSISATGPEVSARWNDQPLLKGTDPHPQAGRSGLATTGPGSASFDEFVFEPAPSRAEVESKRP
jgi:hypothetical protein